MKTFALVGAVAAVAAEARVAKSSVLKGSKTLLSASKHQQQSETKTGQFPSVGEACRACESQFLTPPNAQNCRCFAFDGHGEVDMFCGSPELEGQVGGWGGCSCEASEGHESIQCERN